MYPAGAMEYTIRTATADDGPAVAALYRQTFRVIDGNSLDDTTRQVINHLRRGRVLVAMKEGNLAGFVGYDTVADCPPSRVTGQSWQSLLERDLTYARTPAAHAELEATLRASLQNIGKGRVVMKSYPSSFTEQNIPVDLNDMYCTELAVLPALRRNGVARELVTLMLQNVAVWYVDCWMGGNSAKVFESCGFEPILLSGPWYADGSASLLMGRRP